MIAVRRDSRLNLMIDINLLDQLSGFPSTLDVDATGSMQGSNMSVQEV